MAARRTKQQRQERVSRNQLEEAWEDWVFQPTTEDLGEDFLIQIYEHGQYSKLSFLTQLKSTTDLKSLKLATEDCYSYPLEVKDLLHWEGSSPPVVVIVWDVKKRKGVWLDVPAILKQLDDSNPGWRTQNVSVKVRLPSANTTSPKSGRKLLRERLVKLHWPVIMASPIKLTTTVRLEGRRKDQFLEHERLGGEFTLRGSEVVKWEWSQPHAAIFGEARSKPTSVTLKAIPKGPVEVQLEAVEPDRLSSLSATLSPVRAGSEEAEWATETPFKVRIVLHRQPNEVHDLTFKARFDPFLCQDCRTAFQMTQFLLARERGAKLTSRLSFPGQEEFVAEVTVDMEDGYDASTLARALDALSALLRLEPRVHRFGQFDLSKLATTDLSLITQVADMCTKGEAVVDAEFDVDADLDLSLRGVEPSVDCPETIELLGVRIPVGAFDCELVDEEDLLRQLEAREKPKVRLRTQVKAKFSDWTPPKTGPDLTSPTEPPASPVPEAKSEQS